MRQTHGYTPLPAHDHDHNNGEGSSRNPSATSSLSSSPLQRAIDVLPDQPYELSEKSHFHQHHFTHQQHGRLAQPQSQSQRGLVAKFVAFVHRGRTVILATICLLLTMLLLLQDRTTTSIATDSASATAASYSPSSSSSASLSASKAESAYRLEDDIVLITKVGSATVHKRLLIHLAEQPRSSLYMPNTLYVSDYPLTLSNITFFDALGNVSSTIAGLDEFRSLRSELTALVESNQDLDSMSSTDGGWKLDKYKFLPMVAEAWRRYPRKKWYVVVEADTFVFYNELVKWLGTLDASQQLLLGHPTFCDYDGQSTMFTHGGSGIVMSRGLVEASFGADPDFEHHHDDLIQKSAFGDALLSKSFYDAPGVTLTELSPEAGDRFNSDPPRVLKFHRGNWCNPLLSFHHVTPSDTAHLYDFARRISPHLAADDTVRWGDIWDEFIPAFLRKAMLTLARFDHDHPIPPNTPEPGEVAVIGWQAFESWDSETTDSTTPSPQDCQATCRKNPNCLMWEWRQSPARDRDQKWSGDRRRAREVEGKCRYTTDFLRIGITKPDQPTLTTGWMPSRIDAWRTDLECSGRTGLNNYRT